MKMKQLIAFIKPIWRFAIIAVILAGPANSFGQTAEAVTELMDSAWQQYQRSEPDSAIVKARYALELAEQGLMPEHSLIERLNRQLGIYHVGRGHYAKAIEYWEISLALRLKSLGPDNPDIAIALHGLGNLYYWSGNYVEAEIRYRKAMAIRIKAFGENHFTVAANIDNLANLAYDRGDFTKAERLNLKALKIRETTLEPGDRELAKSYNSLGELAMKRAEYKNALDYYHQAQVILRNTLGKINMPYIESLRRIGMAYSKRAEFESAENVFNEAIELSWQLYNKLHHRTANIMQELAYSLWQQGKTARALTQFNQAIIVRDSVAAANLPEQASCYEAISQLHLLLGAEESALAAAIRAAVIRRDNFLQNGDLLPERQALIYAAKLHQSVSNCLNIGLVKSDLNESDQVQLAELIVATSGLATEVLSERRSQVLQETDPHTAELVGEVERLRRMESRLFVNGAETDQVGHQKTMDSLRQLSQEAVSELLLSSRTYRKKIRNKIVSLSHIRQQLSPRAVLIEFYRTSRRPIRSEVGRSEELYSALVITANNPTRLVKLGEAGKIDALITGYRQHIDQLSNSARPASESDLKRYHRLSRELYDKLLKPLALSENDIDDIYIVPNGSVSLISFAGLTRPDGNYLIESAYIHLLSASRDLIRNNDALINSSGLLAMGDPDYNANRSNTGSLAKGGEVSHEFTLRNLPVACQDLTKMIVSQLPATRGEIEAVADSWRAQTTEACEVWLGVEASEARFKSEAPGRRTIYLATHGYFFDNSCSFYDDPYNNRYPVDIPDVDPLFLSGLFFAGANLLESEAAPDALEDGILTAYEVAMLDLTGTELVVLSACNSGLGRAMTGEGSYGLGRAFQVAGAETVVSSLWSIPDQATAMIMDRISIQTDRSLAVTLGEMQRQQLRKLRQAGRVDHPINWAAFIAVGR